MCACFHTVLFFRWIHFAHILPFCNMFIYGGMALVSFQSFLEDMPFVFDTGVIKYITSTMSKQHHLGQTFIKRHVYCFKKNNTTLFLSLNCCSAKLDGLYT